jgi:hypothetical protein
MSARNDPRPTNAVAETKYYYRRRLNARELLPAVGTAIGIGVVVFYLTKLFLERTPLEIDGGARERPRLTLHRSSTPGTAKTTGRR